jgi:hypothetical protein
MGFAYSKEANQALLYGDKYGVTWLYRLPMADGVAKTPVRILGGSYLRNASWLNPKQCAFTARTSDPRNGLMVANLDDGKETRLFTKGNVNQFAASADGKHLFAVGLVSNELSEGLWHYDVAKALLSCVVPGADHPSPLATQMEELHGSITVPGGRGGGGQRRDYYLYPPANFDPHGHKKYPLVIGNTLFVNGDPLYQERPHGPLWVQALANGGAFVVVVDRQIWGVGIEQWAENVMPMYRGIIQNPAVDRDRVFLFASSGESQYLSQLLATNSGPWKGIMLLNPAEVPKSRDEGFDCNIFICNELSWIA